MRALTAKSFDSGFERLGFNLRERDDPEFENKLRRFGDPSISDADKIGDTRTEGTRTDPFADLEERLKDNTMDELTRDTLRWYIAEERDTGELVKAAYASVMARAGA